MSPRRKRVAVLAVLGTMSVVAPVSSASAAITPAALPFAGLPVPHVPVTGFGFPGTGFGFPLTGLAPSVGGAVSNVGPNAAPGTVVGPTIITTAPSTFINTNNQVSAGGNVSGGQVAP